MPVIGEVGNPTIPGLLDPLFLNGNTRVAYPEDGATGTGYLNKIKVYKSSPVTDVIKVQAWKVVGSNLELQAEVDVTLPVGNPIEVDLPTPLYFETGWLLGTYISGTGALLRGAGGSSHRQRVVPGHQTSIPLTPLSNSAPCVWGEFEAPTPPGNKYVEQLSNLKTSETLNVGSPTVSDVDDIGIEPGIGGSP